VSIVCNGDTAHRPDYADRDLAMPDQFNKVRPCLRCEAEIL
jgi:hypothetical protein